MDGKEGELHSLLLMVDGVHCSACIQKIESALYQLPAIRKARLNFSTKRLSVEWRGEREFANHIAHEIEAQGYRVQPYDAKAIQADSDEEERHLQICLGVAGFAAGNIMMISIGLWTSTLELMGMGTRDLLHWISALITIPAVYFSGQPFFRSAWSVLKRGRTNMDVPISLGVIGAVLISLWQTWTHAEDAYFDSAVMLLFFLLIGRYLDFRARRRARGAASDLLAMMSGTAILILEDGSHRAVPLRDLREGMKVSVPMGQRIPADAEVLAGKSEIDTSLVTGETAPRAVSVGDKVFAGTLNLSAPLVLGVRSAVKDSLLSDIVRLMEKAEQGQAKYVRFADRAARFYTPAVHFLAVSTFLGWWIWGGVDFPHALLIAVTVLIITCPCALGLAVPVVQVLATGRLMKNHILVKSGDALERLAAIDTVLLDKTGTLTLGKPVLLNGEEIAQDHLQLAGSLGRHSHHPLSQAIAQQWRGDSVELTNIAEFPGEGIEAEWNGVRVRLGSRSWCGGAGQAKLQDGIQEVWLAIDHQPVARFCFQDQLRSDAGEVMAYFKQSQITPMILSGDRVAVAQTIAHQLGVEEVRGELTPVDKYNYMEALRAQNHQILMVGDGLNDAPTIAGANVSMSPSTALDMTQNAADIVFMGDKMGAIVEAYQTAVFSNRLVKENFILAILYNVIAVPVAIAGLATPLVAAIAMSSSSIIVIANSFRLSRMKAFKL
ncbi:MAG: cadmium-translocating P-type ATPase [Alphaproteobacteria bacterium]|nr:cadmium-translocating P-type ATPase [Alphaproteobacteria bacterium]